MYREIPEVDFHASCLSKTGVCLYSSLIMINQIKNYFTEDALMIYSNSTNYKILMQIAFTFVVYPSLILAYMGQAAYLSKHHSIKSYYWIGFYVSVPGRF